VTRRGSPSRPVPNIAGIEVRTASPRYLLTVKLMAMRFGEDDEASRIPLLESSIHDAEQTLDVLKAIARGAPIPRHVSSSKSCSGDHARTAPPQPHPRNEAAFPCTFPFAGTNVSLTLVLNWRFLLACSVSVSSSCPAALLVAVLRPLPETFSLPAAGT
jgi:hypothetical protein